MYLDKECALEEPGERAVIIIDVVLPEEQRVVLSNHMVVRIVAPDPFTDTVSIEEVSRYIGLCLSTYA